MFTIAGKTQNPILTKASLQTFFQPVLTPAGEKAVEEMLQETDYQWSTALCVNTTDVAGGRKKGSAWCRCFYYLVGATLT